MTDLNPQNLEKYLATFATVPGYFTKEAMIAWDFFLSTQNRYPITGHFLEIGVLEGKSALLAALHLKQEEQAVLVDINPCEAAIARLTKIKPDGVKFVQKYSHEIKRDVIVSSLAGTFRFIHVDGDHSGFNVFADLALASSLLKENGVICMDDFFNPIYPQATAAIYRYLFSNPMDLRMVLCGGNKCFLVKASAYRIYENLIRQYFLPHAASYGAQLSLHKSSYAHDQGCFSMWTESDRKAFGLTFSPEDRRIVGIDQDNSDIVF